MKLILASTSPFRKAQLERLGITFNTESPEVDEQVFKDENFTPMELAKTLALEKAQAVSQRHEGDQVCVIGGDQVLAFEKSILGKPHTEEKAREQLKMLSGKEHSLITAIAIVTPHKIIEHVSEAKMTMRELGDDEIKRYIQRDQPLNTCGSYMLEEAGITLFEKIDTEDYTSIIGMPLIFITTALRELGFVTP